jgi:WD40 repeat protein
VSFLPDGRHFLYRASGSIFETPQIMLASLNSDESKPLLRADSQAIYSRGHLLFVRRTTLMAQPFDVDSLTLGGVPFPVVDQIVMDAVNGLAAFDATAGGVLTYRTGPSTGDSNSQLTWFDRTGKPVSTVEKPGRYNSVALSSDGTRAAVSQADGQGNIDLWIHEFARGTSVRVTSAPDVDYMAAWSPDASRIAWSSRRDGVFNVYQRLSNGTGNDEVLLESNESKFVTDWSPDGHFLLFAAGILHEHACSYCQ